MNKNDKSLTPLGTPAKKTYWILVKNVINTSDIFASNFVILHLRSYVFLYKINWMI